MRVLAVLPDGNIIDRVRWIDKHNPELTWDVVGIMPDCLQEPTDWAGSFYGLSVDYREVNDYPQEDEDDIGLRGNSKLRYEAACREYRSPLRTSWYHYDKSKLLQGIAELDNLIRHNDDYDVLVTWGERGWYNETAIAVAQQHGKPICRLERATFPGMLVADGTGLEQGQCDLAACHNPDQWESFPYEQLGQWLSVAVWQNIEPQAHTTAGMVNHFLDDRPSIFVPLQVPYDTNMIFRSNGHDNFTLLEHVAEKYPDHMVLVKQHPGDRFLDPDHIAAYCSDHGWEYIGLSTHAIIEAVDKIVSINSQCIIEAWMHNKEVEILGQPAFDLPDEQDKEALLYTLRFAYYIEPWQLTERLQWITSR